MSTQPNRRRRPLQRAARSRRLEQRVKRALLPLARRLFPPPAHEAAGWGEGSLAGARRILLVRQDNRLGNLVLLSPLLQALRSLAPGARIAFLSGDRYAEILDGCPWIDERIVERKRWLIRHLHAYPGYLGALRAGGWDLAFELSNPDTHSFYNTFLTLVSGAPLRVGFFHPRSREALNRLVPAPDRECHYSLAPLLLLSALGGQPPIPSLKLSPHLERLAGSTADEMDATVVVHPGGRGGKRWPAPRFRRLIEMLRHLPGVPIRVIGGPGETDLLAELAGGAPRRVETRVLEGLPSLIRALGGARLFICCDAGPMHVAAALKVPTLALFIDSHPLRYAPLGEEHETVLLGERSRAFATRALFPRMEDDSGTEPGWEARFLDRLIACRPACVAPPPAISEEDEIHFVVERARRLLERPARR